MSGTGPVVLKTYVNGFEAEVDKAALESEGIVAVIHADDCGGMRPHLWMGGIQLLVHPDDADFAREILETVSAPPEDVGEDLDPQDDDDDPDEDSDKGI